jgi:hypothetical protein
MEWNCLEDRYRKNKPSHTWYEQRNERRKPSIDQSQNLGFKLLDTNMVAFLRTFLPRHGHVLRFSIIIEDQGSAMWHAQSAMLAP